MIQSLIKLSNYFKVKEPLISLAIRKLATVEIDHKILRAHNILPSDGSNYKKLGEGSEGVVYQGTYKGVPVAAKITYGQSILEARKWKDINSSGLSEELMVHIPKIYMCWPEPCGDGTLGQEPKEMLPTHQIIVTEILEPLSGESLDALFPDLESEYGYKSRLEELLQNDKLLKSSIDYAVKSSSLSFEHYNEIKTALLNFFYGYQVADVADNESLEKMVRSDIFNYLKDIIPTTEDDGLGSMLDSFFGGESGSQDVIADSIAESFVNYTIQRQFPYGHSMWQESTHLDYFRNHPKSKGLLETLLHIAKESGIGWADVKPQNLMVRPSTGEVVIIDVGRYNKISN